jgi:mannosidase alpha-like ER degradation enhancer 2
VKSDRLRHLQPLLLLLLFSLVASSGPSASIAAAPRQVNKHKLAAEVRAEFLHAWRGYKKYAWSHDDLKPLTKSYHDWYGQPLLMTPVDALDTMILMGLKHEATTTKNYIIRNLSFDKDISVQNFEITIRLLGGLLSSYQLTGDKRLLALANDLGNRLLPAFNSATGMPYRFVNLKTGAVRDAESNPAETGTLLIEFGTLSKLTGNPVFYNKAKRALVETYKRRSPIGLVGEKINVETGQWTNTDSHISGAIDSYYEYLLKCWLLFDDQDCRLMWLASVAAINKYLADEVDGEPSRRVDRELWYGHADMNTGKRTATAYGALDAFFPAVLALSGDLERARRLQQSSLKMWKLHGNEPEEINYRTMAVTYPGYPLRPEIVESTYYLYHYATLPARASLKLGPRASRPQNDRAAQVPHLNGSFSYGHAPGHRDGNVPGRRDGNAPARRDGNAFGLGDGEMYLQMGQQLFRDFVKHCRTDEGYAALKSVVTKEKSDSMQSFLFAETFKYFYLLFAPPRTLDFDHAIFNTEAHPIRRTWQK